MAKLTIQRIDAAETTDDRKARQQAERAAARSSKKTTAKKDWRDVTDEGDLPDSKMPRGGWKEPHSLRGPAAVAPVPHRASTRVLAAAYPFLAESGEIMRGAYIGENQLSRSPFSFDPWEAYSAQIIKSHSVAIIGVKGSGKSMLAKSAACRLARLGRHIAVPHDPNAEWVRVAEYVNGPGRGVIRAGYGTGTVINLMDVGARDKSLTDTAWADHVQQDRVDTVKAIIKQLRGSGRIEVFEHTVIDDVVKALSWQDTVTVRHVWAALDSYETADHDAAQAAKVLSHVMRRMVTGNLAGLFDGPSTAVFDPDVPMMVVDTKALKNASADVQALTRLATTRWVRTANTGSNRKKRVVVHEEAAMALLNEVYGGDGQLVDRVSDEKIARHTGDSNWYLFHRIADLDALGDGDSAVRRQALGLLADCDTRVSYQQHVGEIARSAETLGWNQTISDIVPGLKSGEGIWQMGQSRVAKVKNKLTPREFEVFNTDQAGGAR